MIRLYKYKAKLIKVIDGDTLDLCVDVGFNLKLQTRFRLKNIDTPEIYHPRDDEELERGRKAKVFVENIFKNNNKRCIVKSYKDKGGFGRWLGEIYFEDEEQSLGEQLIKNDLAEHYRD